VAIRVACRIPVKLMVIKCGRLYILTL